MTARPIAGSPLSAADLSFGYADQPRQRTTMGMLLLLDRAPDARRLEAAAWRMVEAVPRLRQRVVDAPFDLAFHVRRYALARIGVHLRADLGAPGPRELT